MRLVNKVALVTGAAQGIGLGIALRLAQEGADIALNVLRDDERAASARKAVIDAGRRCELLVGDVAEVASARAIVDRAFALFTRLDILVNNAGIERSAGFLDVTKSFRSPASRRIAPARGACGC